jgi:hypothetical protein
MPTIVMTSTTIVTTVRGRMNTWDRKPTRPDFIG